MIVLYTTFPNLEVATKICNALVEKDIIKCANIFGGGTSVYKWKGKLETASEVYAYLKTLKNRIDDIEEHFKEQHPYDNPCLIELQLNYIRPEFRDWVENT